ncbi:hypothetical protein H4R34_001590 [Dimargaris verticillata]|uniref:Nucleoporin Nup120/160-domain-containing protein n=1 Tax=Dimargaris verticillata TaxID=2761393 RepID=A0A9W8EAS9_9FUNG|nr:hypothetical protein H4R34_001590 [Dimargaris verticillata]
MPAPLAETTAPYVWFGHTSVQLDNIDSTQSNGQVYNVHIGGFASDPDEDDSATSAGMRFSADHAYRPEARQLTFEPLSTPWENDHTGSASTAWMGESRTSGIVSLGALASQSVVSWRITGDGRGLELRHISWQAEAVSTTASSRQWSNAGGLGAAVHRAHRHHNSLAAPLLFQFPGQVLPDPACYPDDASQALLVCLALSTGHVLRLHFRAPHLFARDSLVVTRCAVYPVSSLVQGRRVGLLTHGIDAQTLAIGCHDGVCILVQEINSYGTNDFAESEMASAGLFSQVKTFLPYVSSRLFPTSSRPLHADAEARWTHPTSEWQPVAMASLATTDIVHGAAVSQRYLFSLGRDRHLRIWSVTRQTCVRAIPLPYLDAHGRVESPQTARDRPVHALPPMPRSYVHVVPDYLVRPLGLLHTQFYVVVYVPDDKQPYFAFFQGEVDPGDGQLVDLALRGHKLCRGIVSPTSSQSDINDLIDFQLASTPTLLPPMTQTDLPSALPVDSVMLWALWDAGSGPAASLTVSYTFMLPLSNPDCFDYSHPDYGDRWYNVLPSPHPEQLQFGTYFDAQLTHLRKVCRELPAKSGCTTARDDLYLRGMADLFLDYLLYPGRFAWSTLLYALEQYHASVDAPTLPLATARALGSQSLRELVTGTVGSQLAPAVDSDTGAFDQATFRQQHQTEWMRYLNLCMQRQASLETPHRLVTLDSAEAGAAFPGVWVSRGSCLAMLRVADTCNVLHHYTTDRDALDLDLECSLLPIPRLHTLYPDLASLPHLQAILKLLTAGRRLTEMLTGDQVGQLLSGIAQWVSQHGTHNLVESAMPGWYNEFVIQPLSDASLEPLAVKVMQDAVDTAGVWKEAWARLVHLLLWTESSGQPTSHDSQAVATESDPDAPWHPSPYLEALAAAHFQQGTMARATLVRHLAVVWVVLYGMQRNLGITFDHLIQPTVQAESHLAWTTTQCHTTMGHLVHRYQVMQWIVGQSMYPARCVQFDDSRGPTTAVPSSELYTLTQQHAQTTDSSDSGITKVQQERCHFLTDAMQPPQAAPSLHTGLAQGQRSGRPGIERVTKHLSSLRVSDRSNTRLTALAVARPPLASSNKAASVGLEYSLPHSLLAKYYPITYGDPLASKTSAPADEATPMTIAITKRAPLAQTVSLTSYQLWRQLGVFAAWLQPNASPASSSFVDTSTCSQGEANPVTPVDPTVFPTGLCQLVLHLLEGTNPQLAHNLLVLTPTNLATQYLWGKLYVQLRMFANAFGCFKRAGAAAFIGEPAIDPLTAPLHAVLPETVRTALAYFTLCADQMEVQRQYIYVTQYCRLALCSLAETDPHHGLGAHAAMAETDNALDVRDKAYHLYFRIFHSTLQSGHYEEAYMAMLHTQGNPAMQRDCLRHLIAVLCETNQVYLITRWSFGGLQPEVERTLLFKARNSDITLAPLADGQVAASQSDQDARRIAAPGQTRNDGERQVTAHQSPAAASPNYYKILYAYHIYRGDYRNASSIMYQYAQRLQTVSHRDPASFIGCLIEQAKVYLTAIQALELVDAEYAWITVPRLAQASTNRQSKKRRTTLDSSATKLPAHTAVPGPAAIPELELLHDLGLDSIEAQPALVELTTIRQEYQLCLAKLNLVGKFPELQLMAHTLDCHEAIMLFARSDMYDHAFSLGAVFAMDLSYIFRHLAAKCVRVTKVMANTAMALPEYAADPDMIAAAADEAELLALEALQLGDELWQLESMANFAGPLADRVWKLLERYLAIHDPIVSPTPSTTKSPAGVYRAAVLDQVLQSQGHPPAWLVDPLFQRQPDTLIRLLLKHGRLESAGRFTLQYLEQALPQNRLVPINHACMRWLPFALFDQLLLAMDNQLKQKSARPSVTPSTPSRPSATATSLTSLSSTNAGSHSLGLANVRAKVVRALEVYTQRVERETEECLAQAS